MNLRRAEDGNVDLRETASQLVAGGLGASMRRLVVTCGARAVGGVHLPCRVLPLSIKEGIRPEQTAWRPMPRVSWAGKPVKSHSARKTSIKVPQQKVQCSHLSCACIPPSQKSPYVPGPAFPTSNIAGARPARSCLHLCGRLLLVKQVLLAYPCHPCHHHGRRGQRFQQTLFPALSRCLRGARSGNERWREGQRCEREQGHREKKKNKEDSDRRSRCLAARHWTHAHTHLI